MTAAAIRYALLYGLATVCAVPSAATELGLSTTFNVGAVVVDLCLVPNAYRAIKEVDSRVNAQCEGRRAVAYAEALPVAAITRTANGVVTAISLEF
ncbi:MULTISPECIES: hypothetical protein [Sphingosinicellaceae]|uniref:hypothetical protein n=1 Tax=Sphingosinicellaceae TaxID=2820280 RepID=UPI001C1DE6B2|nr:MULTISPECIES: hypothetical protein [Polymorphobacter]QYE32989.1 hypothetical protein KZX46_02240 [Polymorphobacter sp. PAMC 29334]UAJ12249.1 hypothetical protein KTC28_20660 [Polymorphobacter megasporae]